ncbi:MAG: D-glycerate dehydrogenase [Deltaproteobacteria bacterium]|nr:D-glycerate dehydrogenase [Deltaproteobacteria bacterium]
MNRGQPVIAVTSLLLDQTMDRLGELGEVVLTSAADLRQGHHHQDQVDAVVSLLADPIDAETLRQLPGALIVANYAVGVNNVDLAEAERLGIYVSNTPDVLTETTADLAFALLLAAARHIGAGERLVRSGRFSGWQPDLLLGVDVHHKTLGVVGYGRIGRAVARRGRGFEMRVLYCDEAPREPCAADERQVDLETLLRESDFVSLHLPLTAESRHLIDRRRLALMKPTAVLVNTARGPVVDEAALAEALAGKRLAAAGLDVYEQEPQVHPDLLALDNVVLAPHLGSSSTETRIAMGETVARNVAAVLRGDPPVNPANAPADPRNRARRSVT